MYIIFLCYFILWILPSFTSSHVTPAQTEPSELADMFERLTSAAVELPHFRRGMESATRRHALSRKQRDLLQELKDEFKTRCSEDPSKLQVNDSYCPELLSEIILLYGGHAQQALRELHLQYVCIVPPSPVLYRPDQHICCNNSLHKRTSGNQQCCNNTLLEPKDQFCCNNQLHRKAADGSLKCCGTFVYNKSREICCAERLHNRTSTSACCYDSVYDRKYEVCCQNNVSYGRKKKCCGITAYYKKEMACCSGRLSSAFGSNNKHGQCCGYENIDLLCYTCENTTKMEIENTTTRRCAKLKVQDLPVSTTFTYNHTSEYAPAPPTGKTPNSTIHLIVGVCGCTVLLAAVISFRKRRGQCAKYFKSDISKEFLAVCSCSSDVTSDKYMVVNNRLNEPLTPVMPYYDQQSVQSVSRTSMKSTIRMTPQDYPSSDSISCDDYEAVSNTPLRNFNINELEKSHTTPTVNLLNTHFVNAQTQTAESKSSNKQTVFGKRFEHCCILDGENNTFQIPDSDVKVIFPNSVTKDHGIEVQGSTFRSIPDIRKRFDLPMTEAVASPVTEYHVTGCNKFPDYACVKVPFVGPISKLKVWKFLSDEGITQTTKRLHVSPKGKDNYEHPKDMFYEIEGSTCLVYTRSFSGFFCTTDGHRPLELRAYLYASYKRFQPTSHCPRHEVRIRMYIADDVMKFKDYKQRMDENEKTQGRFQKEDKVLSLLEVLTEDANLVAYVTPTEESDNQWLHKPYPNSTQPIFSEMQTLPLRDIVQQCPDCPQCHFQNKDLPRCLEWFLTNRPGVSPPLSFQGLVTVDSVMSNNPRKQSTALIIDELPLRAEDRFPAEEIDVADRLRHIKAFVVKMEAEKQQKLLEFFDLGPTFVNKLFEDLELRYKPVGIFHRLVEAFSKQRLYGELDQLYKARLIPDQYCPRPTQRVEHSEVTYRSPSSFQHPTDTLLRIDTPVRAPTPPRYEEQSYPRCHPETYDGPGAREFMRPMTESSMFHDVVYTAGTLNQAAAVGTGDTGVFTTQDQELEPLRKAIAKLEPAPIQENASLDETFPKVKADSDGKMYEDI